MTSSATLQPLTHALSSLFTELTHGSQSNYGFVLNNSDAGLLRSLDRITAQDASAVPREHGSSVAAHVRHVQYGLGLLNRWAAGENPFGDADWTAAWRQTSVTGDEWAELRASFRREVATWAQTLQEQPRALGDESMTNIAASVVHLAYHVGAMRQIVPALAGPPATSA